MPDPQLWTGLLANVSGMWPQLSAVGSVQHGASPLIPQTQEHYWDLWQRHFFFHELDRFLNHTWAKQPLILILDQHETDCEAISVRSQPDGEPRASNTWSTSSFSTRRGPCSSTWPREGLARGTICFCNTQIKLTSVLYLDEAGIYFYLNVLFPYNYYF